jgi:hypothetical protein
MEEFTINQEKKYTFTIARATGQEIEYSKFGKELNKHEMDLLKGHFLNEQEKDGSTSKKL